MNWKKFLLIGLAVECVSPLPRHRGRKRGFQWGSGLGFRWVRITATAIPGTIRTAIRYYPDMATTITYYGPRRVVYVAPRYYWYHGRRVYYRHRYWR